MSPGARFKALLEPGRCLLTPGIYDALSARIAEHCGFEALAIGGFAVEASLLASPDIGLLTLSELADAARRIAGAVALPVTCDIETGFGSVHSIARTVGELEACGVAGVQIEDQPGNKHRPVLEGRTVVPLDEQLARLSAVLAARSDPDLVVIARSDADVVSLDELILRCNRYLAAGADLAMPLCFVVDGRPIGEIDADGQMEVYARLAAAVDGPVKTALIPAGYTAADMGRIGFQAAGLTGGSIEAAASALNDALRSLAETGSEEAYRRARPPSLAAPGGIAELLGLAELRKFEDRIADGEG